MEVNFKQETESGPIEFRGTLSDVEVEFLIEYAIVDLTRKGLMPVSVNKDRDSVSKYVKGSPELQ